MASFLPFSFLLATSTVDQVMKSLFDDSFSGIYSLNSFDLAMLIPYFTVLVILSLYGLHRYETMRTYMKHRAKVTNVPPSKFAELPIGDDPASALQRALCGGAADRGNLQGRLSPPPAADPGPRRLNRRDAPVHRASGQRISGYGPSHRVPSPQQTATASRPVRCRRDWKRRRASSRPSSTPISSRRAIS